MKGFHCERQINESILFQRPSQLQRPDNDSIPKLKEEEKHTHGFHSRRKEKNIRIGSISAVEMLARVLEFENFKERKTK